MSWFFKARLKVHWLTKIKSDKWYDKKRNTMIQTIAANDSPNSPLNYQRLGRIYVSTQRDDELVKTIVAKKIIGKMFRPKYVRRSPVTYCSTV
jgi:hypothetical protein